MLTTGATTSCGARDHVISRSLFTPTQRQELEHQTLIFKYMVSGVPIPAELIYSVKRSLDSSLVSTFFPTQHVGWGGFQVDFGRKADPEPGRCRRTDGKKWRCSKESYRDSKYCERHMNRGRNRKHVEALTSSSATAMSSSLSPSAAATNPSSISPFDRKIFINTPSSSISSRPSISPELYAHQETTQKSSGHFNPFLYPYSSSSSSHPSSSGPRLRLTKITGAVDERAFFPEASRSLRNLQESYGSYNEAYSHHSPVKTEKEDEIQKPLHHFIGEWPPKNTE